MSKESGELLKRFVEESNLTHEDVVRRTGLTTRMLWRLYKGEADLTGDADGSKIDTRLDKIAKACKFPQSKKAAILELLSSGVTKTTIPDAIKNFGAFVSGMRHRSKKTMKNLADECGLRESNFSLIENGKLVPNPATASKIAMHLDLPLSPDLLCHFFQLYGRVVTYHSDFSKSVSSPALVAMLEWWLLSSSLSNDCKAFVGEGSAKKIEQALQSLQHSQASSRESKSGMQLRPHAIVKCGSGEAYLCLPLLMKQVSE